MSYKIKKTTVEIVQGDITLLDTEAIVNPANNGLVHAGGLAAAIVHRGGQIIQQESRKIGYVSTGSAAITEGGHLKAKWVIHAVGPRYKDGKSGEEEKLANAVKASLDIADKKKLKSIALPAISSGIFGYPIEESSKIIVNAVKDYITNNENTNIEKVVFCLFDENAFKNFETNIKKLTIRSAKRVSVTKANSKTGLDGGKKNNARL
jgi:O-acetyl-ADP-ribose deacetylase (regulator of RNase III)